MRKRIRRLLRRNHTTQKQSGPVRKRRLSPYGWALLVILAAALTVGTYWWFNRPGPIDKLDLTVLETSDRKAVQEGVHTEFSENEVYPVQDYAILGETLTLYQNPYDPIVTDPTLGKNITLRNILTGEELSYTFGGGGDLGIQTGNLPEGVYEIYLYDQYDKKRVYFDEKVLSDPLETMRRDKSVKSVVLDADRDILSDYDITLDRNYAFLVVTDQVPRVKTVDVVLDPGGNLYNELTGVTDTGTQYKDSSESQLAMELVDVVLDPGGNLYNELTGVTDTGTQYKDSSESQLAMELADLVAARLEAAGLKVAYTRQGDDIAGYYGDAGRAAAGYSRQGKVFLSLVMTEDENTARPWLLTSPRQGDDIAGYYGDAGRAAAGYSRQGKVFLSLVMTEDENTARPWLLTSPFVSGSLPSNMAYALRQAGIELRSVNATAPDEAVAYDTQQQNEDWSYNQFSMTPAIRETGGKITWAGQSGVITGNQMYQDAAGMYPVQFVFGNAENEDSMEYYLTTGGKITWAGQSGVITGNQMYQDAAGMYPVQFVFGNAENEDSMEYYLTHKEQIADGLAAGILEYYGIEPPESDSETQTVGGSTGTPQASSVPAQDATEQGTDPSRAE